MRVGYFSDSHCEFRRTHPSLLNPSDDCHGDVLIVAGDLTMAMPLRANANDADSRSIKRQVEILKNDLFKRYRRVLYIAGNHEHYNGLLSDSHQLMREFFQDSNVLVIENDRILIDDVIFVGATLWSDFMKASPVSMDYCQGHMNDFHIIWTKNPLEMTYTERNQPHAGRFKPYNALDMHLESKQYISDVAENHPDFPIVVFTHHCPTYKSLSGDHMGNGLDGAYASDLSNLILDRPNIKYWIHGHTHYNVDYMVGECRVLANQCGYAGERSYTEFKGPQHFEI